MQTQSHSEASPTIERSTFTHTGMCQHPWQFNSVFFSCDCWVNVGVSSAGGCLVFNTHYSTLQH